MDMYGETAHDFFHIDDLLNFSNDDIFYSSSSSAPITDSDLHHQNHLLLPPENHVGQHQSPLTYKFNDSKPISNQSNNFTDNLCVPSDDVAELEWLSMYVDDSFTDVSLNEMAETTNFRQEASFPGRARSKRSRAASTQNRWNSLYEYDNLVTGKYKQSITSSSTARKRESSSAIGEHSSPSSPGEVRKCMHCASEKTPQWRTGPLGPKTLCNACGVRYKSGRLVPEYRPAASPTFVLTQHSNSHRKVMELRRQKENLRHQEISNHQHQQHQHQHQHHNQQQLLYKVC